MRCMQLLLCDPREKLINHPKIIFLSRESDTVLVQYGTYAVVLVPLHFIYRLFPRKYFYYGGNDGRSGRFIRYGTVPY